MKTWSTMEEYFRALERCLDCPGEDRERFLAQARRMADDFLQGKPDATPDEVAGCLGEPEELAQCFLEELDPELLERRTETAAEAGQTNLGGRSCGGSCGTLYLGGLVGNAPPSS